MSSVIYKDLRYEVDKYDRLMLSGLEIEDLSDVKGLEKLQNVKSLSLQNNKISKIKGLDNLEELETLYLYYNEIEEIRGLERLKNLNTLILKYNNISKIERLGDLDNLIELNLSYNQIEEIEGLEALSKLKFLDLQENNITDIKGLDSLKNLQTLYLNNNKISEIKGLENLDKLTYLRIENNPILNKLLDDLGFKEGATEKTKAQKVVEYCIKLKEEELIEQEKQKGRTKNEKKKEAKRDQKKTKFLTTIESSARIEKIVREAKERLILISPFLKMNKIFYDRLKDADKRGINIIFIYGKRELRQDQLNELNELKNLELYYCENLHAKCYCNENMMVITSLNLLEFSQNNNREMGILIKKQGDVELYNDVITEINSIINASRKIND